MNTKKTNDNTLGNIVKFQAHVEGTDAPDGEIS